VKPVVDSNPASHSNETDKPLSANNLVLRIASAAVLAPLALVSAYSGGWPFVLFWGAAALAMLWEWMELVASTAQRPLFISCAGAVVAAGFLVWLERPLTALLMLGLGALAAAIFAPSARRLWVTLGMGYAGAMLLAPVLLRHDAAYGFAVIILLFSIVWTTDVCGYFAGRAFGGPKLMPVVSPKKTWSGAIAGTAGAMIAGTLVAGLFGPFNTVALLAIIFVLSVLAQFGDLFESWVKRQFGAKDSSRLIPGHGGVMDRLDGFWAAAVAGCLIGLMRGGFDGPARGLLVW
jgi:phosphatidate cytidylyltransferase